MADINDPRVIDFWNRYMRPLAETARNHKIRLLDAKTEFQTNIAPLLSANLPADKILDGSPADGRTVTTKQDGDDLIALLATLIADLNVAGVDPLLSKFTVSPPRLNG